MSARIQLRTSAVIHRARSARPPSIEVWRSVRERGDTKTRKSRRTLRLPARCVDVLSEHLEQQAVAKATAGDRWQHHGLVFCTSIGTELDAANVRRDFRRAVALTPGLNPVEWTPRELRHSFVSLLSASGVTIEQISQLVGHKSTQVTETVYRHELRPVLTEGAEAMDETCPETGSHSVSHSGHARGRFPSRETGLSICGGA
jgi:integrase